MFACPGTMQSSTTCRILLEDEIGTSVALRDTMKGNTRLCTQKPGSL